MTVEASVLEAVIDYTGRIPFGVSLVPDSEVDGTWAVRAVFRSGEQTPSAVEFLITRVPLNLVTADDLEEVEFTAWPPTSKKAVRR